MWLAIAAWSQIVFLPKLYCFSFLQPLESSPPQHNKKKKKKKNEWEERWNNWSGLNKLIQDISDIAPLTDG